MSSYLFQAGLKDFKPSLLKMIYMNNGLSNDDL